jgi:hypothetical protein
LRTSRSRQWLFRRPTAIIRIMGRGIAIGRKTRQNGENRLLELVDGTLVSLVGKTALWKLDGEYAVSNHMTLMRMLDQSTLLPSYLAPRFHKFWYDGYSRTLCRRYVRRTGQRHSSRAHSGGRSAATCSPMPAQRRAIPSSRGVMMTRRCQGCKPCAV